MLQSTLMMEVLRCDDQPRPTTNRRQFAAKLRHENKQQYVFCTELYGKP